MMARALEHNGAEKVYILGRRKDILENAAKTNNVLLLFHQKFQLHL